MGLCVLWHYLLSKKTLSNHGKLQQVSWFSDITCIRYPFLPPSSPCWRYLSILQFFPLVCRSVHLTHNSETQLLSLSVRLSTVIMPANIRMLTRKTFEILDNSSHVILKLHWRSKASRSDKQFTTNVLTNLLPFLFEIYLWRDFAIFLICYWKLFSHDVYRRKASPHESLKYYLLKLLMFTALSFTAHSVVAPARVPFCRTGGRVAIFVNICMIQAQMCVSFSDAACMHIYVNTY